MYEYTHIRDTSIQRGFAQFLSVSDLEQNGDLIVD